jgi:hypothetical protein
VMDLNLCLACVGRYTQRGTVIGAASVFQTIQNMHRLPDSHGAYRCLAIVGRATQRGTVIGSARCFSNHPNHASVVSRTALIGVWLIWGERHNVEP